MELDTFIDTLMELLICFNTYSTPNKICIILIIIAIIAILCFLIVGTIKIIFQILQTALTMSVIGIVIYIGIRILIWFAENV